MFTGDRSGDWLYRALHQTGFASQPISASRDDGQVLTDVYITATARCAPPDNKPTPEEIHNCRPYLERELELLSNLRVVVALGKIAFDTYLDVLKAHGVIRSRAAFAFGHNREFEMGPGQPVLMSSYHPSQQNTSTGKLTEKMLLDVFRRARDLVAGGSDKPGKVTGSKTAGPTTSAPGLGRPGRTRRGGSTFRKPRGPGRP